MARVEFIEVGRDSRTWVADVPWDEDSLAVEAKAGGRLMSSVVDVELEGDEGVVVVGGWREVGRVRRVKP